VYIIRFLEVNRSNYKQINVIFFLEANITRFLEVNRSNNKQINVVLGDCPPPTLLFNLKIIF
jgi:hypothetical protein